jgi:hypothetical protein
MAGFCGIDQTRAGIDSSEARDAGGQQWRRKHTLAAADIDHRFARLRRE